MRSTLNIEASKKLYARAIEIIPGGSQTNSLRPERYAFGAYPIYFQRGKGSRVWDVDGNEYIDYVCHAGSQRAAISIGIMLSSAQTFGLPMILDEAFDRIDTKRLKFFCECITGLADLPSDCQICLAGYTSFNIEKNPDVLPFVNNWRTYLVERSEVLEKNIRPLKGFALSE